MEASWRFVFDSWKCPFTFDKELSNKRTTANVDIVGVGIAVVYGKWHIKAL